MAVQLFCKHVSCKLHFFIMLLVLQSGLSQNILLIDTKSTGESLHWLIFCILQSGRCLPECHPSGRLHHDGDKAGLE